MKEHLLSPVRERQRRKVVNGRCCISCANTSLPRFIDDSYEVYASQGGRTAIRRSNRDQENLPLMRFSSIIDGRREAQRWDTTGIR
jgi:hypothetical protein